MYYQAMSDRESTMHIISSTEIDYSARPATNSMPIFMENVQCSGRELSFLDCSYNRDASNNQHSRDVGVQCKMCKSFTLHIQQHVGIKENICICSCLY